MIKAEKRKEIAEWILSADEHIVDLIDQLKEVENTDWWDELSSTQKTKIQKGYKSVKEGKTIPHRDVAKKYGL